MIGSKSGSKSGKRVMETMPESGYAVRSRRKKAPPRRTGPRVFRLKEPNAAGGMPACQLYGGNLERQGLSAGPASPTARSSPCPRLRARCGTRRSRPRQCSQTEPEVYPPACFRFKGGMGPPAPARSPHAQDAISSKIFFDPAMPDRFIRGQVGPFWVRLYLHPYYFEI
jgi:hypothetical protein